MFRNASARFAAILSASLLVAPATVQAQKALAYCPVGIDASGCNAIVTALNASPSPFPGGVDGGYDGSQGTIDLATADLSAYAVFLVPSLADGAGTQPYGLLRDATVAARLQAAFMGRVAVWSGTPDVGSTNRSAKDGLIRNLASWAKPDAAGTHGPGVVAFQDNSDDAAVRYGWLGSVSSMSVSPDTTFDVYSNAQVLTATGQQILTNSSGLQIGYANMATYGLVASTSGSSSDATGGRTARVVLMTVEGDPSDPSIATVTTDREDYFPPDTVIITGAGWGPGETVSLLFQQDVNPSASVTRTTLADSTGHVYDQQFVIDSSHIGVRFTLTATGQTSGKTAQATFTDATKTVQAATSVSPITASITAILYSASTTCPSSGGSPSSLGSFNLTGTAQTIANATNTNGKSVKLTANATSTNPAGSAFINWTSPTGGAFTTVSGEPLAICIPGTNGNQTDTFTPIYVTTSTSVVSSVNPSLFGQSVTFTATVTSLIGGTPTGTVTFKDGAATIGTGALSGGQATLGTSTLSVGSHTITAVYGGSGNFTASTSSAITQTVSQAGTTTAITSSVNPSVFGQSVTFTATVTAVAPSTATPAGTVQFQVDGVNTGPAVTLNGSGVAISGSISSMAVGSHTVAAIYSGNSSFSTSTSTSVSQAVNQASTTTTVSSPSNPSTFGQSFTFTATVAVTAPGSGTPTGTVQFRVDGSDLGSPVALSGLSATSPTVSGLAVGPHTLSAIYGGNGSFSTSTSANFTHTVGLASQTITFSLATLPAKTFGDPPFSVASYASASSGLTVTFSSTTPTKCTSDAAGNVTILTAQGNCTIRASQAGNANFSAAPDVDQSFNVAKAAQTISFTSTAPVGAFVGGPVYTAAATATSGLTVTFGTSTPLVCTSGGTNGATITMVGGGNCIVTANQTGNGDYLAAPQVTQNFAVTAQQAQTISFTSTAPSNAKVGGPTYTATATATSGLTVTFSSLDPLVCSSTGTNGQIFTFLAVGTCTVLANQPGNAQYLAATQQTQPFTVGKGDQTITFGALGNKTYGNADFGVSATASSGLAVTFAASGNCSVTVATVHLTGFGSCTITGSQVGNANYNAATDVPQTFTIAKAPLAPHITADNKPYNGNTDATILTRTLSGVFPGDVVSLTGGTASFDTKHVGTGKTVTGSGFGLAGGDAGNYELNPTSATTMADITVRTLTVTATGINKVYDQTTTATVTLADDRLLGDVFGLSYTANFNTKDVGTGKPVSVTAITIGAGAEAGDYVLGNTTAATTANITVAPLAPHITADNKPYNGNTDATILTRTLSGVFPGDAVSLTGGTASFDTKHVGTGKTVTGSGFGLAGGDAGNYELNPTSATTMADITVRTLTVTATGINKVYDQTTTATVTLADDRLLGDVFGLSYTANFNTKDVGTGKPVSVTAITIGAGAEASDYVLGNTTAATTANITVAPLAPHFTADNKPYNGNTDATILTRTLSGVFPGDVVSLTGGTASFDTKHVGTGKTVTGSGFGLAGGDAGNYELNPTSATTMADITVRTLTVTATGINKVYDQTTTATVTLADDRLLGDVFGLSYTANFNTKDVGTGKPVSVTAITIGAGAEASDYVLGNTTAATTANITQRDLTVAATGINKPYDGNTSATVTLSDNRVSGDVFTDTYTSASFLNKNAGVGKTVNVSGIAISGTDAGNYHLLNTTATTTANIDQRGLTVTATGQNKYWDGNTTATVTLQDNRVSGDLLTVTNANANFADANTGVNKLVTVTGINVTGLDAGNYTWNTTTTTTASILTWTLSGFYQPVDMPVGGMVLNSIKGGQTVPLKFEVFVGSVEQTTVAAVKTFTQVQYSCPASPVLDDIEITSTGGTVLRYDGPAGQFIQNWQTPKTAGLCYRVTMTTQDNSSIVAYFKTK